MVLIVLNLLIRAIDQQLQKCSIPVGLVVGIIVGDKEGCSLGCFEGGNVLPEIKITHRELSNNPKEALCLVKQLFGVTCYNLLFICPAALCYNYTLCYYTLSSQWPYVM